MEEKQISNYQYKVNELLSMDVNTKVGELKKAVNSEMEKNNVEGIVARRIGKYSLFNADFGMDQEYFALRRYDKTISNGKLRYHQTFPIIMDDNNKVYDFYLRSNSSEYERTFSTETVIGIPALDAEIEISEEEYNALKGLYDTISKNAVELTDMFNSIDFTEQWQGITVDEVGDFSSVDLGEYNDDVTIKEVIRDNVNKMSEWTAKLQKLCGQFICLSHPFDDNKIFMRLDEVYVNESKHCLKGLILEYNSNASNGISIRYDSRILNTDIGIVGEDEELYNAINDYMDTIFNYQEEYEKCIDNHIIKQNLDW